MRPFLLLSLTLLALSGCSAGPNTPVVPTGESAYLAALEESLPEDSQLRDLSDQQLLDMAAATCDALEAGVSLGELMAMGLDQGMDAIESTFVPGYAHQHVCPESP